MNGPVPILADGLEDLLELLPWLAIAAIGLLIKIATTAAKRKQAKQQKQRWEEIRHQRAGATDQQQAQRPPQAPSAEPQPPVVLQPSRTAEKPLPSALANDGPRPSPAAPLLAAPAKAPAVAGDPLGLAHPDLARKAIVYHEVFSGCKALRRDSERWDL